ncbi:hypothetical protein BD779DRAFT_153865 [Infundibulicybe gibba]|nr:hypothetical protein BD779DRAFT_153865 [Infundibulicybe gibba]
MDSCPEPLEKIFQRVEEASERRAQEDLFDGYALTSKPTEKLESSTFSKSKSRRRGSISITRFGELADESNSKGSQGPSTPSQVSSIASQSPFYKAQMTNDSNTSFASGASAHTDDLEAHTEDNHITQMHKIAGRQSISKTVGGLLPRRLSRARSAHVIANGDANVVIGVSVEAKVEATEHAGDSRAQVHAPGNLRSQPSKLSMHGPNSAPSGWMLKAKGFTQKFRRKSRPTLRS